MNISYQVIDVWRQNNFPSMYIEILNKWKKSDYHYSYSYSYRVTLFNELFSEESCRVIGLSEKMGFQLWSELSATDEQWAEVRWKCVPDDRSRDGETSQADGRVCT